jgi:AbrB family looped-hinge helix DNA binding protein
MAVEERQDAVADKNCCFHGYVAVQSRGVVALPASLRKRLHLDEPGAQVEITEREDGVLELRPTVAVPASEAWFWIEQWQVGEKAVDAHVAAGEVTEYETAEDFLAHLDTLDAE